MVDPTAARFDAVVLAEAMKWRYYAPALPL